MALAHGPPSPTPEPFHKSRARIVKFGRTSVPSRWGYPLMVGLPLCSDLVLAIVLEVITAAAVALVLYVLFPPN
jgi:hypothetical protein